MYWKWVSELTMDVAMGYTGGCLVRDILLAKDCHFDSIPNTGIDNRVV